MKEATSPRLSELLRQAVRTSELDLHVSLPARVEAFDAGRGTVDVTPLLRRRRRQLDGEDQTETFPRISRVPVCWMRWGGFVLRCPIAPGDRCMIVASDVSLEDWLAADGGIVTASSRRAHELDDVVAMFGPSPWASPPPELGDGDLVLAREDGAGGIRIRADGSVLLGTDAGPHSPVARRGDRVQVDLSGLIEAVSGAGVGAVGWNAAALQAPGVSIAEGTIIEGSDSTSSS